MVRFLKYFGLVTALLFIRETAFSQHADRSAKLKKVASFGKHMALGTTVTSDNRLFVSFPDYDGLGKFALIEIDGNRKKAYPNKSWNSQETGKKHFLRVQDIDVDARDNLWVLDSKPAASGNIFGDGKGEQIGHFKLIKIDTKTDEFERVYTFDDLDKKTSALNDVRIDLKRHKAYLSDPGQAAIVILDLKNGQTRRVLSQSRFTKSNGKALTYKGQEMRDKKGNLFTSDVNGIALTADFTYFYFKPINQKKLFRLKTDDLNDSTLSDSQLKAKVETVGKVGNTHGLIADKKGRVYLTTSEDYSISYVTPEGGLHTLVKDPRLLWPDSLGIGPDGYLYFSCTQLQRLPQWNNGVDKTNYPYRIFRVKLP